MTWGALHGTYLTVQHAWHRAPSFPEWRLSAPASAALSALCVFGLTTFAWLFFRAPDFGTAAVYLAGLLSFTPGYEGALLPFIVLGGFTLLIDVPQALSENEYVFLEWPVGRRAFAAVAASVVLLIGGAAHAPFIYFQF